jgi:hypothetical protein
MNPADRDRATVRRLASGSTVWASLESTDALPVADEESREE